jgi:hypothetical protein
LSTICINVSHKLANMPLYAGIAMKTGATVTLNESKPCPNGVYSTTGIELPSNAE